MHVRPADRPPGPEPTIDDVEDALVAPRLGSELPDDVLDDRTAEVRGVLDQRLAGDLTDQILARGAGLEVIVELGHGEHAAASCPRDT